MWISTEEEPINWEAKGQERIIQNAKNILRTQLGEIPYDRMCGMDPALKDIPLQLLDERVQEEVDMALQWEPDVRARNARWRMKNNGEVSIEADIVVLSAG